MATFQEIKTAADNPENTRKILEAVAFLAPEDAAPITTLIDATGALVAVPAAYLPVGLVSPDGYTFGGDTNTEDVEALGYTAPVRTDITSRTRTIAFTAYEVYKKLLMELIYGVDLSAVTMSLEGEITFDHPDRPAQRFYRGLVIGRDGSGDSEWLRGKYFPRVSISEFPEEVWSAADASSYPITLSTFIDEAEGTAERDFIAGTGAVAGVTGIGFTKDTV